MSGETMANSNTTVRCEPLTLPTYGLNAPDPNVPVRTGRRARYIYPYPMLDDLQSEKADQTYESVVLENEYLKVIVLPELGGRLYSAYDKVAGRELFYKTDVIKPGLVALRGAWIAGGVEFNFPVGHHCLTHSRVDYRTLEQDDGSVSVCFGAIEQLSRMRYSVTITLKPGRNQIFTDIRLENRTGLPHRYYFWSNSAQPVTDDTRFITPATSVYGWSGIMRYPVHEGVDISWYRNHPHAGDLFTRNLKAGFFGHYDYGRKQGTVNVADPNEVTGRKYFTWGNSHDGLLWEHILSDGDGPYIEIQCGPFPTQMIWKMLEPHRVHRWKESWFGIRETEGIGFANEDIALNLAQVDGRTKLAINATRAIGQAEIRVTQAEWEMTETVSLGPHTPLALPLEIADPNAGIDVAVVADGVEIARATLPWKGEEDLPTDPELADGEKQTARGRIAQGDLMEKAMQLSDARACYEAALEEDPLSFRALVRLGVLDLKQGVWSRAVERLDEALRIDQDSGEARYYRGYALRALGRRKEARRDLWRAWLRSSTFGSIARTFLGEMAVEDGHLEEALEHFEHATSLEADGTKSGCLRIAVLRELGRIDEARSLAETADSADPINPLLTFERALLAEDQKDPFGSFKEIAHGESQTYIEVALDYARAGFPATGLRILDMAAEEADGAMVRYITGHLLDTTGQAGAAKKAFTEAAKMSSDYVFPHRVEEEAALTRALEADPEDGNAAYYLGTLLYMIDRKAEGRRWWERAVELGCDHSALLRLMGLARWKDDDDPSAAEIWYERAISSRPDDFRLHVELDEVREAMGWEAADRLKALEAVPAALQGKGTIGARTADLCVQTGAYDRAAEILSSRRFDPWEGARAMRDVYTGAHVGRGEILLGAGDSEGARKAFETALEYPLNVAVGKTWRPSDAPILYRAGVACEKGGDRKTAEAHWAEALGETHHPIGSVERTYVEMCRQKLDGGAESTALATILAEAEERQRPTSAERRGRRPGTDAEAFQVGGLAAYALGQRERALGMLERAVLLREGDAFLRRLLDAVKDEK